MSLADDERKAMFHQIIGLHSVEQGVKLIGGLRETEVPREGQDKSFAQRPWHRLPCLT